ncbi:hypothetical protein [Treponema sp. OMZ 857]|uniref:hypothetical protein n=1 Tax=Treponema sp. OMZ 857 TaxID=1643513 RepID=UPI0020A29A15|nr:hypothetical protein [Treponema sp. OMZ 857]UTC44248.1 hypothetical protein E4N66_09320 [Treponema sp. OMZ 857]
MKKMNRAVFLVLIVLTVLAGVTCKPYVGLGGQIDILPPSGEITYPDAGETPIRGSFVLKGTAKDDDGIQSISVVFENIETKERSRAYEAEGFSKGNVSASWTISVNNESTGTEPGHDLVKVYPIPDGEYTAIVTVTDKGEKTSTFTKNYKIDNTPPVFIVSRPSMVVDADATTTPQADGYGAIFSVVGQAGERNTVEKLNMHVPGATPIDITNMFVGNSINAQVAVYSAAPPLNPLYDLQEQDKTKPIRGQLYLYDNAREYKGGDASGEGNKADWYYLWKEVYTEVIAKGYTPEILSDYFAGKKGSDANEHDKKIKELRSDTVALVKLKSAMIKMSDMRSVFKLDPSKSPGFKVIGSKHLSTTPDQIKTETPANASAALGQASAIMYKDGGEASFLVELIPNKDNIPLVGGSNAAAYKASKIKIVLYKWKPADNAFDTAHPITLVDFDSFTDAYLSSHPDLIKTEGDKLRIQCTFPSAQGEGIYAVDVQGRDTSNEESNEFKAYDNSDTASGMYALKFYSAGSGPRTRPIRLEGFKKANAKFIIAADVTGIDTANGHVYCNIGMSVNDSDIELKKATAAANDPRYEVEVEIVKESGKYIVKWKDPAGVSKQKELPDGFSDGTHMIKFLSKAGPGLTDTDETDFVFDTKAPTVKITYPEAGDPQAGEITVSGSITDAGAGVKETSTKYILGKKTSTPTPADSGWNAMDSSTKWSWNVRVNLDSVPASERGDPVDASVDAYYNMPLYILTEDEIGNKAVEELKILFNPNGTKPVVKILSPQADATVGGTIQIFGTASAAIGGAGAVGEVYIQFSHDGTFANTADGTFGSKDWYNGGNGVLVPGTSLPGGGADWRISINGDGSFNHATAQNQPVYFRVRAKNKNGLSASTGKWTEKRKIIVDKDAPLIADIKIDNASGTSSPQDYELNMWLGSNKKLTARLTDPSGIQDVKITFKNGTVETKYQKKDAGALDSGHAAVPAGWLTDYNSGGISGYTLNLPFDISSMTGDSFSVTIEVKEKASQQLSSNSSFMFRFDTKNPIGDYGVDKHMNIGNFTSSSITDTQLAQKVTELGGTASSGGGCKILTENSVLTVTKVTGSKVQFTASPALTAGSYSYILYKPELLLKKNNSGKWIINGVANDSGSGVKEVKAKVKVNGVASSEVTMTETGSENRITKQLGGMVTWQGDFALGTLDDGKGELHYQITDKSGNTYGVGDYSTTSVPAVAIRLKNKPIRVSEIQLSTDIGGTQSTFKNTSVNNALTETIDKNSDYNGIFTGKNFSFKSLSDSKIKVAFTGGEGQVKYTLKYNNAVLAGHNMENISSGNTISLSAANLNTIGNSTNDDTTKELVLELWDSAHGCTTTGEAPLAKKSFAEVKINAAFGAVDTKEPTVVILPFHWNSETDNSLYQNSRANGHVEIVKINSLGNDHSSVSGKVTLRGFAYDNIKIDSIKAELPFNPALTVTATRSGTTWTSDKKMFNTDGTPKDNAELTVTTSGADYLGYYAKWELSFDSSKIPMGAAKDIKVIANDGGRNSAESEGTDLPTSTSFTSVTRSDENSASSSSFASVKVGQFVLFETGEKRYLTRITAKDGTTITLIPAVPIDMNKAAVYSYTANKTKTAVNSVPYITNVETGLTSADSSYKGSFSRASTGEYPVWIGEKIKITGFNLNGATYKLGTQSLDEGTGSDKGTYEIKSAHSTGALVATVSSVESINNKVDITKPYNIEANNMNNDVLTANRKLFVWETKPIIDNNFMESPQFVMDKNSNYYMSYGVLALSGSLSFAMMKNATIPNNATTMAGSYTIEQCFSKYQNTIIAYDESGEMYGGASNTDRNSGSSTSFTFFSREQGSSATGNNGNYNGGTNRRRLENNANKARNVYDVGRVQIPKLAVRGDSSNAKVALIYYDRNNDTTPVKFRYGTVTAADSISGGLSYNVQQGGGSAEPTNSGSAKGYEVIADSSTTHKSGLYAAVGLTSTNRAVAVWYDAANAKLIYSYRDMGAAYTEPTESNRFTNAWQDNAVEIDGDAPLYVDLVVDDENGLHIGYYSSGKGGVKYAYLAPEKVMGSTKPTTADFKIATVDTYMNPGTLLKIGVRRETINSVQKQVPYISYYHNGFYGSKNAARMAWLKDGLVKTDAKVKNGVVNNKFTGDWVVMTVPASNGIQQYTICQGAPTGGMYQNKVIAAYFTNKNYEMAVLTK